MPVTVPVGVEEGEDVMVPDVVTVTSLVGVWVGVTASVGSAVIDAEYELLGVAPVEREGVGLVVLDELDVSVPDREGVIVRVLERVLELVTVIDGVSVIMAEELNEMEGVPVTDVVPVDVDVVEGVIVRDAVWDAVPVGETLGVWDDVVEEEMVAEAV